MQAAQKTCIESATIGTMKLCGVVTKHITEGFYTVAPFMRPRKRIVKQVKPEVVTKSVIKEVPKVVPEVSIKPVIRETIAEKAVPKVEIKKSFTQEAAKTADIEKNIEEMLDSNPGYFDKMFSGITFNSKIEKVQAEIYVKDFMSKISSVREKALTQLKKMPKEISSKILISLLKEKNDVLQLGELLNTIASMNDDCSLDRKIFTEYLENENLSIRMAALRGIVKYKDDESFDILSKFAKNDVAEIRRQALNLLYWTYGNKCISMVMMHLHDIDNNVRMTAMQIASSIKIITAVSPLITYLSDPSIEIQKSANEALKKITNKDFEFNAKDSEKNKKEAIEQWRFWWRDNQVKK
ncbi:MAG: HEAT repeat domain-containing protein [Candidatus Omnitrophica bacterium]|nr:HEAT repeat domain-containing protein [Candidatus Omnitrophota bacterium]